MQHNLRTNTKTGNATLHGVSCRDRKETVMIPHCGTALIHTTHYPVQHNSARNHAAKLPFYRSRLMTAKTYSPQMHRNLEEEKDGSCGLKAIGINYQSTNLEQMSSGRLTNIIRSLTVIFQPEGKRHRLHVFF